MKFTEVVLGKEMNFITEKSIIPLSDKQKEKIITEVKNFLSSHPNFEIPQHTYLHQVRTNTGWRIDLVVFSPDEEFPNQTYLTVLV